MFDIPYSDVPYSGRNEENVLKPVISWRLSFVSN